MDDWESKKVASILLLADPDPTMLAMALRSDCNATLDMSEASHPYKAPGRMVHLMTNSLSALEMGTKASLRTALAAFFNLLVSVTPLGCDVRLRWLPRSLKELTTGMTMLEPGHW